MTEPLKVVEGERVRPLLGPWHWRPAWKFGTGWQRIQALGSSEPFTLPLSLWVNPKAPVVTP
jgi:hypothetical protein